MHARVHKCVLECAFAFRCCCCATFYSLLLCEGRATKSISLIPHCTLTALPSDVKFCTLKAKLFHMTYVSSIPLPRPPTSSPFPLTIGKYTFNIHSRKSLRAKEINSTQKFAQASWQSSCRCDTHTLTHATHTLTPTHSCSVVRLHAYAAEIRCGHTLFLCLVGSGSSAFYGPKISSSFFRISLCSQCAVRQSLCVCVIVSVCVCVAWRPAKT